MWIVDFIRYAISAFFPKKGEPLCADCRYYGESTTYRGDVVKFCNLKSTAIVGRRIPGCNSFWSKKAGW